MKSLQALIVGSLGVVLAAACGGSSTTTTNEGGAGDDASGSSGGSSSGSSSGSSGSSSGSSGGSSSGAGDDGGPVIGDCPNCQAVCCLAMVGGQVQGTCAATAAACPTGAGALECMANMDCSGGQTCCVTGGNATSPASAACVASCPTGHPACGGSAGDNTDCPGGAAGWACVPVPGTPMAVLGICVPSDGGVPEGGGVDGSGTPDASDAAPQDSAPNGG
jgi:hypothetical protein